MKIVCAWMYAIGKYGFPPKIDDIKYALHEMKKMGFEYVEAEGIGYDNLRQVIENRGMIKQSIEDYELSVADFAILLPDVISLNDNERQKALEWFDRGVETAVFLGSPFVWIDSYFPPIEVQEGVLPTEDLVYGQNMKVVIPETFNWDYFWERFVDSIYQCNEIAKKYEIQLLLEPRVGEVISNTDAMLRLASEIDDDNLGFILDTAHQHAQKEILPLSVEKLDSKLRYIHIADNDGRDNRHLPPGQGTIDWNGLFKVLKQRDYDGFFAIDLEKLENIEDAFIESKGFLERFADKYGF